MEATIIVWAALGVIELPIIFWMSHKISALVREGRHYGNHLVACVVCGSPIAAKLFPQHIGVCPEIEVLRQTCEHQGTMLRKLIGDSEKKEPSVDPGAIDGFWKNFRGNA